MRERWLARQSSGSAAPEFLAELVGRVQAFVGEEPQFDDLTLVAISRNDPLAAE